MTTPMPHRFAADAESVMSVARLHALTRGEPKVTTEGLCMALILERHVVSARILTALRVTPGQARAWLDHQVGLPARRVEFDHDSPYTPRMQATLLAAAAEASAGGTNLISAAHLLIGLLREPRSDSGAAAGFLVGKGVTVERVRGILRRNEVDS